MPTFGGVSPTVWDSPARPPGSRGDVGLDPMALDSRQPQQPSDTNRARSSALSTAVAQPERVRA